MTPDTGTVPNIHAYRYQSIRSPLSHVKGGLLLGVGDWMEEGELGTELHYLCKFFLTKFTIFKPDFETFRKIFITPF
jgi:hypothetical protein